MQATTLSRYGTKRIFDVISNDKIKVTAVDNLYTRILGSRKNICAIDFEGGPFLSTGYKLTFADKKYKITHINEGDTKDEFILTVIDVTNDIDDN